MSRIEIINENDLEYIKIYACNKQKTAKAYSYGPTIRNHHLIHYVISGKGRIRLNGKYYECEAGSLIWVPQYNPVMYIADDEQPWNYAWIGISGGETTQIYDELHFSLQNPIRKCPSKIIGDYFTKMVETFEMGDEISRLKTLSIFYKILSIVSQAEFVEQNEGDNLLFASLEIIKNNYWKQIKINDIALELGINRSYLYKIFQENFKMSPKKYLDDYRMSVAYELLTEGCYSAIQVSEAVGFQSPTTFSTRFKKKYGLSPIEHVKESKVQREKKHD